MTGQSWSERLLGGLKRTSERLGENLSGLTGKSRLDDNDLDRIEDALITALLMAVGFVVSNQLLRDRFHGATPMLSLINGANTVVTYLAMGLVLALV